MPEYADAFRRHCASLPPGVAAKALAATGRLAAQERHVWRQTRALGQLPGHYRIRIGRSHRMLFAWDAGKTLTILDLIPRKDLERWINTH